MMIKNPREIIGRLHSTESFGAVDGPGVRFVVFLQGCPLRCLFCHNPDAWDTSQGSGISAGELIDLIAQYKSFIGKGGVTISGGEPLIQPQFCMALTQLCHEQGLHVAIDTSGGVPLSQAKEAIDAADMLLLDIKDIDPVDCKILTGQTNENAIAILDYCELLKKPVWIRHVCIPDYTLKEEKLWQLAKFLQGYSCVEKVELIPFHQLGSYKWQYVDKKYELENTQPPSLEEMQMAEQIFKKYSKHSERN